MAVSPTRCLEAVAYLVLAAFAGAAAYGVSTPPGEKDAPHELSPEVVPRSGDRSDSHR